MDRIILLLIGITVGMFVGMTISEILNAKLQQEYERALTHSENYIEELQAYIDLQKQIIIKNMRE